MELAIKTIKIKLLEVWCHTGFQKYFRNTGWLFLEKILRIFVGLFVGVWIARYLGPEKYGLYNYAISFAGLFTVIASFGLNSILVRELVKNNNKKDVLLGTAFILKIIGAVVSLLIMAFATLFVSHSSFENVLIFVIASAVIFQSFNVIDFYFQSKVLSKYVVYANVISLSVSSIAKVALILSEASLIYFAFVIFFDSLILVLGYLYFYKRQGLKFFAWKFDYGIAKNLLKDSWPLILSGISVGIYMKIDQVMIKNMLGDESVGLYSAAVKLSEVWYFIPVLISSSLFPAILNAKKKDDSMYNKRLKNLYSTVVYLSLVASLFVTFFAEPIINVLYGAQYMGSVVVLKLYVWSGVFVSLGVASSNWYLAENLQLLSFLRTFIGAIINVILNLILIKMFGLYGAAISTLVSYSFAAYFFDLFSVKTRKVFFIKTKSLFLK